MSFSEFYQRSINEPEQFWPSRPGVLTGRRPLRKRSITAIRRLPVGFVKPNQLVSTTLSTAGWRNSQRRWR